eukprot:scaffold117737_cov25-Cyclotella_meneghiniana.AAC.1
MAPSRGLSLSPPAATVYCCFVTEAVLLHRLCDMFHFVGGSCSTVRCKKCCVEYCFGERQKCECKDHVKRMKERKQRALEELAEACL